MKTKTDWFEKSQRIEEALREYQRFNHNYNNRDIYLWDLAEWALENLNDKPDPKDYGVNQ